MIAFVTIGLIISAVQRVSPISRNDLNKCHASHQSFLTPTFPAFCKPPSAITLQANIIPNIVQKEA